MRLRPRRLNTAVGTLFVIGSAGFAVGSLHTYASAVGSSADAVTFFVSSIFFTLASFGQLVQSQSPAMREAVPGRDEVPQPLRLFAWLPHDREWLSAATQFPGTVFFNATTLSAIAIGAGSGKYDVVVWRPDFFGSVLFLVSSVFAILAAGKLLSWQPGDDAWRIAWLNMLGSVAFMASAIGAYAPPRTGTELDPSLADRGTFAGALCFLVAALLSIRAWGRQEEPGDDTGTHAAS